MTSTALKLFLHKLYWFAWEQSTSVVDAMLYAVAFPAKKSAAKKDTVVYIGEFLPPRTPRMVKWLKREQEMTAILICHQQGFVKKYTDSSFDATFLFRNKWHLKKILKKIPGISLVHGFAPKSYYSDIARRAVDAPYIHDLQDSLTIYYGLKPVMRWQKHELPYEKACLEKSDGLVSHSMEPNAAYRMWEIKEKPPTLFFPLYCDDDFFITNKKTPAPDDIHVVYAGGVAASHRDPKRYGNIQFKGLIKTLSGQKIHFHLYPSPSKNASDFEEYIAEAKHNPFFHFHESVAQQELSKELAKYHFGILPFFRELSEQSDLKLKYATTLKLFNYLEAGLPVVVSKDLGFQSWIVERNASGITIGLNDIPQLGDLLRKADYATLQQQTLEAREKLSLKKNTHRLVEFYARVKAAGKRR